MPRSRRLPALLTAGSALLLTGCIFLTNQHLQSVRLLLRTSQPLPAGELTEVYSSIFPTEVRLKGNFVKVFGHLEPPGGAGLPARIRLQVVSADAESDRVYHRFNLPLRVAGDGSFSGIKKWTKNLRPDTLQLFLVEPQGTPVPAGTAVSLCIEVVKRRNQASPDRTCSGDSSGTGDVVTVQVLDNRFDPQSLTVEPGDTVRWVLQGNALNHTVTGMNNAWDSGLVFTTQGARFELTFSEADRDQTFQYFCRSHHACCQMQGSIRVGSNAPAPDPGY